MKIRKLKSAENIKKYLESSKTEYVKVAITDIDGILRGKYMHVDKFIKSSKKGFGFCDVIFGWDSSDELYELKNESVDNLYTGWHSGFPDAKANIIPESGRINPFEENIPFFLAELSEDEVCPRGLLNKIINKMEDVGIRSKSAFEYEFFLFNETPHSIRSKNYSNLTNFTPGMYGYSILRSSVESNLYNELLNLCLDMDMHLEGLHTETGPGVIEAAITVDDSLNAADKATLFKTFSIKPTYFLSPEVIDNSECVQTLLKIREHCELGTHLHADYIEPKKSYTNFDGKETHAFQTDYSPEIEFLKLKNLTDSFYNAFNFSPKVFRSGRYAANKHTIKSLNELGYKVDSSFTPHLKWLSPLNRTINHENSPEQPYFCHHENIYKESDSSLLEIPISPSLLSADAVDMYAQPLRYL